MLESSTRFTADLKFPGLSLAGTEKSIYRESTTANTHIINNKILIILTIIIIE